MGAVCAAPATPLDSGLRRNDETGRSYGCHLFSYEGMKSRSCGLVRRICTADSATPHPDPSGGQAPRLAKSSTALHFLIPPSTIGLQFGTFRRRRTGMEGASRFGVRDMLSCQSLMPAGAGTPRYETCVVVGGDVLVPCVPPLPPLWIPAFAGMTNGGPD